MRKNSFFITCPPSSLAFLAAVPSSLSSADLLTCVGISNLADLSMLFGMSESVPFKKANSSFLSGRRTTGTSSLCKHKQNKIAVTATSEKKKEPDFLEP